MREVNAITVRGEWIKIKVFTTTEEANRILDYLRLNATL